MLPHGQAMWREGGRRGRGGAACLGFGRVEREELRHDDGVQVRLHAAAGALEKAHAEGFAGQFPWAQYWDNSKRAMHAGRMEVQAPADCWDSEGLTISICTCAARPSAPGHIAGTESAPSAKVRFAVPAASCSLLSTHENLVRLTLCKHNM